MPDGVQHRVAALVRAEMAFQRKTQADLAEALGISAAQVSKRLAGKIVFDVRELVAIADFLGVPATRFLPAKPAGVERAS